MEYPAERIIDTNNRYSHKTTDRRKEIQDMNEIESKIIKILMDQDDSINYAEEKHLIDNRILDSFAIISLVSELEEEFDIRITAVEMVPENFNSVEAMAAMVQKLQG